MWVDHRQPGCCTTRPIVRSPRRTYPALTASATNSSSGRSRLRLRPGIYAASGTTSWMTCRRVPAAGLADLGGERLAQRRGDESGGLQDALEVDAVLEPGRVEEVDEVLGREIAGGAG